MASTEDTLFEEEEALFQQAQGLAEMELELHAQEEGLAQMEQRFSKRNQTLTNLMSYIAEQGESLTRRAEAIGPRALKLAQEALGGDEAAPELESVVGKLEERQVLVERRREFLAMRQELAEERANLLVERQEAIEEAEGRFAEAEERLLAREQLIAKTLRQILTAASELEGDEDDEEPTSLPPSRRRPARSESSRSAGGKPMTVHAGSSDGADEGASRLGGHSRLEDEITRGRRAGARVQTPSGGFRIMLEIVLGPGESGRLFRYQDDGPEDLPGVFLVTPSLLKEGREVRMRIHVGEHEVNTDGVVSWRRTPDDGNGPAGMGIEIIDLKPEDEETIRAWMKEFPPLIV